MTTVLLASSSPRRTALLTRAGVGHVVVVPPEDMIPPAGARPERAVLLVARAKAAAVARRRRPGTLVVAADTIVVGPGGPLGKPGTPARAREMLAQLRGRRHLVLTGIVVLPPGGAPEEGVSRAEVTMRRFTDAELDGYVASGEPLDKAGGYAVQGEGARLIRAVVGRVDTVVGLDVRLTIDLLHRAGHRGPLPGAADVAAGEDPADRPAVGAEPVG